MNNRGASNLGTGESGFLLPSKETHLLPAKEAGQRSNSHITSLSSYRARLRAR